MKIKWLGHSSFLISSDSGTRIVTDPYTAGRGLNYGEISEVADVVTVSHGHGDHNNVTAVRGNPQIVDRAGKLEVKGIKIEGIGSHHDDVGGAQRGPNIVFRFEVDGVRVCHLGDLGHVLSDKDMAEIGSVDILLIPVGGLFTINAETATAVSSRLSPKVVVPMHYRNDKCAMPLSGVDDFLKGKTGVNRLDSSEAEFVSGKLPFTAQIIVLRPAL